MYKLILSIFILLIPFFSYAEEIKEDQMSRERFTAWNDHCKKCHGNGKKATKFGLENKAPLDLFFSIEEKTIEDISNIVRHGHNNMPAYNEKLTEEEINLISKFLKIGNTIQKLENRNEELKPYFEENYLTGEIHINL